MDRCEIGQIVEIAAVLRAASEEAIEGRWTDPQISFYATDAGRAAYFARTTEDIIRFNREALAAGEGEPQ